MATRKLTLGHLYPDIMSACGDRGNITAIMRRCGWRAIVTEIHELRLGDPVHPDDVDIFIIGDGGESRQRLVAPDLADVKGMAIREAVEQGAALLAVGAGYELLGRFYQPSKGVELPGVGLFDAWTIQHGAGLSAAPAAITEAWADRATGDLLVRWEGASPGGHSASPRQELLAGFENHSARTYLGPTARALGQVVVGQGNNGDGREGVWLGGAVGTYMRGPCLPRNPALADFLIGTALWRRYGEVELEPLADDAEHAAHDTAVRRITAARAGKRPGLRRVGTRLGRVVLPPGNVSAAQCLSFVLFVTYSAGPGLAELAPRPGGREASRTVGLMDEKEILGHIDELIKTEHELRAKLAAGELSSDEEHAQLRAAEAALDQCWDLLRQRRARREFGEDPGDAALRPVSEVEGYMQ